MASSRRRIIRRIICLLSAHPHTPLLALAEACLRFTPQIARRADEALFLDVTSSVQSFSPSLLPLRLQALAERFSVDCRIGMADNAALALAKARYGENALPLDALFDLADPFGRHGDDIESIARLIQRLQRLGCTSVLDLKRFSPKSLGQRFGKMAADFLDTLNGGDVHGWPRMEFPETIVESVDLTEQPCAELEPMLFVLRASSERIMLRLRPRGKRLARLGLRFHLEGELPRSLQMNLATPQGTASGLLTVVREKLAREFQNTPLSALVVGLELTVLQTAPGRSSQKDFFHRHLEETESMENLVGRLQERLGAARVYAAVLHDAHRPEAAWRQRPPLEMAVNSQSLRLPARPTRLLKHPLALQRFNDSLKEAHGNRKWQVLAWEGPERISGEWWTQDDLRGFARDYYIALTESGEKLWLFLGPNSDDRIYLHGYFD